MTSETSRKQKTQRRFGHVTLSPMETAINWLVWMPLNLLTFYVVYGISVERKGEFNDLQELTPSWLEYKKDTNDREWEFWHKRALQFLCLFICNSAVVFFSKQNYPKSLNRIMVFTALALHCIILSWKGLAVILCQILCFYTITLLKSRVCSWICTILMIMGVNNAGAKVFIKQLISLDEKYSQITVACFMMSLLRLVSFGCYVVEKKLHEGTQLKKKDNEETNEEQHQSLLDCLNYVLYVPIFYNGPVVTYDVFIRDMRKSRNTLITNKKMAVTIPDILKDLTRCVTQYFGLEIFLHFMYIDALFRNHWMLEEMSGLDAGSISWVYLYIFNFKYYIFYRFSGLFAKLDGIEPPGPPKCIASLYTFVDMWRTFDKGLYRLLQQCIYFPLGGSRAGLSRQIIVSCLCFSFVGLWHGGNKTMMFWALTNWAGIVAETILGRIAGTMALKQHVSCAMYRRLCAAGGSLSVFGLIYTNMVFLIGYEGATILLSRVFVTWYVVILILLVLYFKNQCSIDVT